MKNIFKKSVVEELTSRIEKLTPETKPEWGKMNTGQMLAHLNIAYDYVYDSKYEAFKAKGIKKFMLKLFVKNMVVGDKPYPKNGRTDPDFLISEKRNFTEEKNNLISYMNRVMEEGEAKFEGKESHSFGILTKAEWNNMFYKHADHHLKQFGV